MTTATALAKSLCTLAALCVLVPVFLAITLLAMTAGWAFGAIGRVMR